MKIEVVAVTENPVDVISRAAGACYGKSDVSEERVRNCLKSGHMSVFEHASATLRIEGISRACSHQLVRHRLASFCQESQRYCKYDLSGRDWYFTPLRMINVREYEDHMRYCASRYMDAIEHGIKPEDARYLLPEATCTSVVLTMNVRELLHFIGTRPDGADQWEIRGVANGIESVLKSTGGQWRDLMTMFDETR